MTTSRPPEDGADGDEAGEALDVVISQEGVVTVPALAEGEHAVLDKRTLERLLTDVVAMVMAPGYEPGSED